MRDVHFTGACVPCVHACKVTFVHEHEYVHVGKVERIIPDHT